MMATIPDPRKPPFSQSFAAANSEDAFLLALDMIVKLLAGALILGFWPATTLAAEAAADHSSDKSVSNQELAKEKHNPFADQITLPIQLSSGVEVGPGNGTTGGVNIQPVVPVALGEDWNVILRPSLSLLLSEQPHRKLGLGDLELQTYVTPTRAEEWIWGIGPVLQAPTATATIFGTGKWSAGPGAGFVYVQGPWVNGILVNHVWSFAGESDRDSVSQSTFEPAISYSFDSGWFLSSDSSITADWNAPMEQRWTIPVGIDVGKAFEIGKQSMSWQIGAYYNVRRAEGVEKWTISFQFSFIFPKYPKR